MTVSTCTFSWPRLATHEVTSEQDRLYYSYMMHRWTKVCEERIEDLPCTSICCKRDNLYDQLFVLGHLTHALQMNLQDPLPATQRVFIAIDRTNKLQGMALTIEHNDCIEINTLITSPENIRTENKVKGVGRILLKRIAREHGERHSQKQIVLRSSVEARGFYEKFGFKPKSENGVICYQLASIEVINLYNKTR